MTNEETRAYFGTDEETYYVASDHSTWTIQSPDLAGTPVEYSLAEGVPSAAIALSEDALDESLTALGDRIEGELNDQA